MDELGVTYFVWGGGGHLGVYWGVYWRIGGSTGRFGVIWGVIGGSTGWGVFNWGDTGGYPTSWEQLGGVGGSFGGSSFPYCLHLLNNNPCLWI
uniref:Uncharacterized protein n=1 Tax=Meloidogyne enterolobii TaxID=390850 RepID=A0A6V7YDH9_MELEN|nr:unnamed protein product [Meloidogyne enterolobii]